MGLWIRNAACITPAPRRVRHLARTRLLPSEAVVQQKILTLAHEHAAGPRHGIALLFQLVELPLPLRRVLAVNRDVDRNHRYRPTITKAMLPANPKLEHHLPSLPPYSQNHKLLFRPWLLF